MPHEPKLSVYELKLRILDNGITTTNRTLFRYMLNEVNDKVLTDSFLFGEIFKKLIQDLDKVEMYKDPDNKKTMTVNQAEESPKILYDTAKFIIHGIIEGGTYGRKRKKTSTENKANKSDVTEKDAITDDFFFMIYVPPHSDKSVLMIQSFTDETIDTVMKRFFGEFFSVQYFFNTPKIERFTPQAIIDDFKQHSVVTKLGYSTTVPGNSLLDPALNITDRKYKVTISIVPLGEELTVDEFEKAKTNISEKLFADKHALSSFKRKKAVLRDTTTNKNSDFELNSDFDISPIIYLNKYIDFPNGEIDYQMLTEYCRTLLTNQIMPQIYIDSAIQER